MSNLNLSALLEQLGDSSTTDLNLLAQLLSRQAQISPPSLEHADEGPEEDAGSEANMLRRRRSQARAFRILQTFNKELALACGACICWGHHASCPRCHGEGCSGFTDPDPALFRKYIEPVLFRMGLIQSDQQTTR